ncbi:unnamed protein product [Caenorhabditis bovis]|uniref:Plasminogen receptor (KT) n=1 Tax=Caenorhabditis bovis TaxID=2654633 RepID=A0A8S1ESK2_9PELO|nr:unnamed protein product [Caenorhabditis bovis]
MGAYFSSQPSINVNQTIENLEKIRMEREIAFAQLQEKRRIAYHIAEQREKLNWEACGGGLLILVSAISSIYHKNLFHVVPMFPVAAFLGYKTHYCYGDQLQRINDQVNDILEQNAGNLVPLPPSISDIRRRAKQLKNLVDDEI